jgi:hypothetical protein
MLLLVDIATVHSIRAVTMRALLFQPLQLTLVLALLPSCRPRMNDE